MPDDRPDPLAHADRVAAALIARLEVGLPPDTRPFEERVRGFERVPTEEEAELARALGSVEWCPPFDWVERFDERDAALAEPERLDARDLCQALAILLRQERYAPGGIADAARSGLLLALLRRFRALARGRSGPIAGLFDAD